MIPARRSVERATSTRSGRFPRVSAVPRPIGVTAFPRDAATASASAVSWASPGTANSDADTPSTVIWPFLTRSALKGMDAKLLGHRLHAQRTHLPAHVALR